MSVYAGLFRFFRTVPLVVVPNFFIPVLSEWYTRFWIVLSAITRGDKLVLAAYDNNIVLVKLLELEETYSIV